MWVKGIKMVEVLVVRTRDAVKKWWEQWVSRPRERSGEITGGKWREGDSREERRRSDSKWHRNTALAASIQQYAGLAERRP